MYKRQVKEAGIKVTNLGGNDPLYVPEDLSLIHILSGIGSGIVIRSRGSLGGTDIISVILYKYLSLNIGGTAMAFNAVILTLAAVLFNVEMAMLTLVGIYIANKAVDTIQEGFNHRKTIIIVSDKYEEISAELLEKVKRGITLLDGHGAYTGREKR